MIKIIATIILILTLCNNSYGQYYEVSFKKDIAPMTIGAGLAELGILLANKADKAILEDINLLNSEDVNSFDRGATNNFSSSAKDISDVVLYTSATLPFITYFSKKCRASAGPIAIMFLETGLINSGITNIVKSTTKRYRPYNYNPLVDTDTKLGDQSRRSFFSGHASNTAAFAFLTARIITDIHPNMKRKYLVWTTAATIPAVIGYLRVKAGRHFPTDVITGYLVGASIGYFIPSLHLKNNSKLSISTINLSGLNIVLKF